MKHKIPLLDRRSSAIVPYILMLIPVFVAFCAGYMVGENTPCYPPPHFQMEGY